MKVLLYVFLFTTATALLIIVILQILHLKYINVAMLVVIITGYACGIMLYKMNDIDNL